MKVVITGAACFVVFLAYGLSGPQRTASQDDYQPDQQDNGQSGQQQGGRVGLTEAGLRRLRKLGIGRGVGVVAAASVGDSTAARGTGSGVA